MKVIKQRYSLVIRAEDDSDKAFLEDTMGFTPDEPAGVVTAEFSPTAGDIGTGKRTGEIWNLIIKSIKEENDG